MAELNKEKTNTGSNAHTSIKVLCKFPDYHFGMMMAWGFNPCLCCWLQRYQCWPGTTTSTTVWVRATGWTRRVASHPDCCGMAARSPRWLRNFRRSPLVRKHASHWFTVPPIPPASHCCCAHTSQTWFEMSAVLLSYVKERGPLQGVTKRCFQVHVWII